MMYYTVPWDGNDIKYQMNRTFLYKIFLQKQIKFSNAEYRYN